MPHDASPGQVPSPLLSGDEAHARTDKALARLEQRLAALYRQAGEELQGTIQGYFARFAAQDEAEKKRIGTTVNGREYTGQDYKWWRLAQMSRGKQFEAFRDTLAQHLAGVAPRAAQQIDEALPGVYALNRSYAAYVVEQEVGADLGLPFWDEATVRRLLEEDAGALPQYPAPLKPDLGRNIAYNRRQITAHLTSGILMGESIQQLAARMQTTVPGMDRSVFVQAARTAVTGAQNGARLDSYQAARQKGVGLKKRWLATLDGRTRTSHGEADGQVVDLDEPFLEIGRASCRERV